MKMKLTALLLAIVMVVASAPFAVTFAEEADGFVYTIENDEVTITDYNGDPDGTLTIPDKIEGKPVTVLGDSALRNHKNLTGVVLPSTLKKLDLCVFTNTGIVTIHIPASVEEITDSTFYSCGALKSITVDGNSKHFSADENGILYSKDKTKLICFPQLLALNEYTLPDSVVTIGHHAFSQNGTIEKINFNSRLKSIGSQAFCGCKKLADISLPSGIEAIDHLAFSETAHFLDKANWEDGVLYMGEYLIYTDHKLAGTYKIKDGTKLMAYGAFDYNPELEEIIIPASLKTISQSAFVNNGKLTKIEIPETVEKIEPYAFQNCSSLKRIAIPEGIKVIERGTFEGCTKLEEVVFPHGLTTIGEVAFEYCEAFEKIELPESVTTIGIYAFYYCRNLKEIYIPDSVTYLGEKALSKTGIKSFTVPNGVTKIEPGLLSMCESLEEIVVHDGVTEICDFTFDSCRNFKTVNYEGTQEQWKEIKIGKECNEVLLKAKVNYNYVKKGDVDMNGKINSGDALLVLQCSAGLANLDEKQTAAAMVNGDDKITSGDALAILQFATGLVDTFR